MKGLLSVCTHCIHESTIIMRHTPSTAGDADHPGLSIAWGTCGHVFHLDCIQRWLKTRSACPLCNREVGARDGLFACLLGHTVGI